MPAQAEIQDFGGNANIEEKKVWVFGYGSLIWKPNFKYERVIVGSVTGVVRRFWQGSHDHRGTIDDPGRVATLIAEKSGVVYGLGFQISQEEAARTFNYLNDRETGYITKEFIFTPVDPKESKQKVLLYIANKNNADYMGPDTLETMAGSIARCVGHSGPNYEYLFNLAHMTRLLFPGVEDKHLFELEDAVKKIRNGYVGNTK